MLERRIVECGNPSLRTKSQRMNGTFALTTHRNLSLSRKIWFLIGCPSEISLLWRTNAMHFVPVYLTFGRQILSHNTSSSRREGGWSFFWHLENRALPYLKKNEKNRMPSFFDRFVYLQRLCRRLSWIDWKYALDILQWMCLNKKYLWMDIFVFIDMSLIIHVLWISISISMDLYGYPCMDLLWILDPRRWGVLHPTWRPRRLWPLRAPWPPRRPPWLLAGCLRRTLSWRLARWAAAGSTGWNSASAGFAGPPCRSWLPRHHRFLYLLEKELRAEKSDTCSITDLSPSQQRCN